MSPTQTRTKTTAKPSTKPSTAKKTVVKAAPAKKVARAAAVDAPAASSPVSPKVAARHFRKVLQAKQERVRRGPNYPAANAFTGRHAVEIDTSPLGPDTRATAPAAGTPAPEALTGSNSTHGRGNQGMRKQK
ncbi:MAG: hypothetical protein ABI843_10275 [Dokdonella sp.]